ncbi:MAG: hypothetical protein HQK51_20775 [Oligoflexia bacterium]|nr:hypothetical protein [Oligoflexia bacterium]
MRTIYDSKFKTNVILIVQGEYAVAKYPSIISTTLGSCISICLFDLDKHVGGINHYMLPGPVLDSKEETIIFAKAKYGIHSIEILINELLKLNARKENLKAKIFGGANMFKKNLTSKPCSKSVAQSHTDIYKNISLISNTVGMQNISFAEKYLKTENIPIVAKDVGGEDARKIYFDPATGFVKLFRLNSSSRSNLIQNESQYRDKLEQDEKKEQKKSNEVDIDELSKKITLW